MWLDRFAFYILNESNAPLCCHIVSGADENCLAPGNHIAQRGAMVFQFRRLACSIRTKTDKKRETPRRQSIITPVTGAKMPTHYGWLAKHWLTIIQPPGMGNYFSKPLPSIRVARPRLDDSTRQSSRAIFESSFNPGHGLGKKAKGWSWAVVTSVEQPSG